jgi:hypothetical protein
VPADCSTVGWQERDWAKWTDEERSRYLGSSTRADTRAGPLRSRFGFHESSRRDLTLLAMLVSLGLSLATWHFHFFRLVAQQAPAQVPRATIVYGTGLAHMNGQSEAMTCTTMEVNAQGSLSCTAWTILSPGQQAVQAAALPAGTTCTAARVDQQTGRWVCLAGATTGSPSSAT